MDAPTRTADDIGKDSSAAIHRSRVEWTTLHSALGLGPD
jgi:hypothetical protein